MPYDTSSTNLVSAGSALLESINIATHNFRTIAKLKSIAFRNKKLPNSLLNGGFDSSNTTPYAQSIDVYAPKNMIQIGFNNSGTA